MNDERDLTTRQAARYDHELWASQHAAWREEAHGWLQRLDEQSATLDRLRGELSREQARIKAHLARMERHEGAITAHDWVLAELDRGTCGTCEEGEPVAHQQFAHAHAQESLLHTELAERQQTITAHLAALSALFQKPE